MWFSYIPGKSQITNLFSVNTKDPLYSSDNVKQHMMVQKCTIYTLLLHGSSRVMMCGMWLEIEFLFLPFETKLDQVQKCCNQCFKNVQEIHRQTLSLYPHSHLQHRIKAQRIMSILSVSPSLIASCCHISRRTGLVIVVDLDSLGIE